MKLFSLRLFYILSLCLLSSTQFACSGKSSSNNPNNKKIYIKGDPKNLYKDAQTNSKHDFHQMIEAGHTKFYLSSVIGFIEKEEVQKIDNIQDGNESKEKSDVTTLDPSLVFELEEDINSNVVRIANSELKIELFNNNKKLVALTDSSGTTDFKLVHFSQTPDAKFFSLLLYGKLDDSKVLLALYFSPLFKMSQFPEPDGTDYYYLDGKGLKMTWPQTESLKVNFCNHGKSHKMLLVDRAVEAWQDHLENRLNIEVTRSDNFAPFSDLNQKCIYVIENYISLASDDAYNFGATLNVRDYSTSNFIDSDIWLFEKEYEKMENDYKKQLGSNYTNYIAEVEEKIEARWQHTFTHEFGHLLGLGHPFTKENPEGEWSIMSYSSADYITYYDISAIQNLYPVFEPTPEDVEPIDGPIDPIVEPLP